VKTNVEKIGGTVDVQSKEGHGTTLRLKIPLTLAIIPALIVMSEGQRFAIPQVSLLELVRLEGAQAKAAVESIHGAPVFRLRESLLPLVQLNRSLGLSNASFTEADAINIVVLEADDRPFGLVVDAVTDTEEIVVKPLGKELKRLSTFAGAAIMGDGKVALILDVLGVAQRANVVSGRRDLEPASEEAAARAPGDDKKALLLFRLRSEATVAIPLSMVTRLEEFPRHALECAGGQKVIQYRGEILPLIDVGALLVDAAPRDDAGDAPLQVVVYSEHGRSVGLVVERILDIIEEPLSIVHKSNRRGVLGAAIIQGRVTEVLDVQGVIRVADPTFFDQSDAA